MLYEKYIPSKYNVEVRNESCLVENEADIIQHVLKLRYISYLQKYIKRISMGYIVLFSGMQ
jgi:hypothetical protein